MMSHQTVIVLDFGGQYNQLIARRVRECGVYCEVKPYTTPLEQLRAMEPIGFIFTGGPNSVYEAGAPKADPAIFELGVPVLGICYGCQFMAHALGGQVTEAHEDTAREYGKTETYYDTACKLFKGLPEQGISWMSHGDYMAKVPEGFALTAHSDACPNVAIADEKRGLYGVQYHPEVNHTEHGVDMIRNFLYEVCGAKGDWTMGDYKESSIKAIREKVGGGKVLLALSGGVDSSVAAALLAEAVGEEKGETVADREAECLIDLQISAHIPESYIAANAQRLDVYRRIADIRTHEDSLDVYDELIDRFGEPPAEAVALLDIALLRSQASGQGIAEIKQQDGRLLLTFAETDFARLSVLCGDSDFRGRLLLNAGSSPYLSLRLNRGEEPLAMAQTLVAKYAATA